MTGRLIPVCGRDELGRGEVRCVRPDDVPAVAVYDIDGELHATADRCTHAKASLAEGELDGDVVVCPVHAGTFHVPTGKALGFPATRDLDVYDVVEEGGTVYVCLPAAEGAR